MYRFGHFQPQIKRGTSNLPLLLDESPMSNHISVELHDIPASCFFGGGYLNLMSIKQQAQAAPPHEASSFPHLRRPRQLGSPVTTDYFGHPRHQKMPASSSPAGSDVSSDKIHQYFQLKDDHRPRRNNTENICDLNSNATPALESSSVKSVVLPLPISSSASTTKAISHQEKKTPYRQQSKSDAMSSLDPENVYSGAEPDDEEPSAPAAKPHLQNLEPSQKKRTEQEKACTPTIISNPQLHEAKMSQS